MAKERSDNVHSAKKNNKIITKNVEPLQKFTEIGIMGVALVLKMIGYWKWLFSLATIGGRLSGGWEPKEYISVINPTGIRAKTLDKWNHCEWTTDH